MKAFSTQSCKHKYNYCNIVKKIIYSSETKHINKINFKRIVLKSYSFLCYTKRVEKI